MNMAIVQQTYIVESRELLRDMESALLRLEKAPQDAEAITAVFRAAHTIKGSSGAVNFDAIVAFTHAMEGVLEQIRSGRIAIDGKLIALLLACGDHVSALLDCLAADDRSAAFERIRERGENLLRDLGARFAAPPLPAGAPREAEVERIGGATVASGDWHISLRFGRSLLKNGLDPLSFIRYLGTLGKISQVTTVFDAMPDAADMDPESCYLGMELDFNGAVTKETIEDVFEYLREDCAIRILPPHSKISDYVDLINALPEDKVRLGELLVKSGALTRRELDAGLRVQAEGAKRKIGEILVGQGAVQDELVTAALEKQDLAKKNRAIESSFVRVRADKLDELITLVGELVIASAGTALAARRAGDGDTIEAASTMAQMVEEVRDRALKLRMVPIGETFTRYSRIARDLGRELGKEIELALNGTETELDKSMVEKIADPLLHLVRNAIDHGIEPAGLRRERGKPAAGRLQLNAYHDSGSIVIEVSDDGGGLDRKRIFERAVERGMIAAGHTPGDEEIHRLIMQSGFSTARTVSNISGRGVGMDVVRRNIESLRGTLSIDSAEGQGTTFTMRLPLTLAIIEGFLVGVDRSAYVVPLEMVVECLELPAEDRARVNESGYINLRGEVLPLLRLREVFEVQGEPGRRENIVVVNYAGQRAGFVVDTLLGEFQTVIKPLGRLFERLSGISGSTILGNGEVALILDAPALVERAVNNESVHHAVVAGSPVHQSSFGSDEPQANSSQGS
jgi:two-component system chemotaxis sensor kinase CheA